MISITAEFSRVLVCLRSTVSIPSFTPQNKGFPSMEVAMLPYEVQQILNGVGLTDTVKQCVGSPLSLWLVLDPMIIVVGCRRRKFGFG